MTIWRKTTSSISWPFFLPREISFLNSYQIPFCFLLLPLSITTILGEFFVRGEWSNFHRLYSTVQVPLVAQWNFSTRRPWNTSDFQRMGSTCPSSVPKRKKRAGTCRLTGYVCLISHGDVVRELECYCGGFPSKPLWGIYQVITFDNYHIGEKFSTPIVFLEMNLMILIAKHFPPIRPAQTYSQGLLYAVMVAALYVVRS